MDKKRLTRLRITKVDLCNEGANPEADIMIFKSLDIQDPVEKSITTPIKEKSVPKMTSQKVEKIDLTKATPEQIVAYATSLEKSVDAHEEEFAKAFPPPKAKGKKKGAEPDEEDAAEGIEKDDDTVAMTKSVEAIQKTVDEQAVELKKANDRTAKLELDLKKANDATELAVIEKSVEKEMPHVPGTVTEIAKMLQQAKATLTADAFTTLEKALKAGSEAIKKASQEIGSTKGQSIGTAEEEFFKAADELVTKGVCKTRPDAVVEINKSRKDLAEAYRLERSAKR